MYIPFFFGLGKRQTLNKATIHAAVNFNGKIAKPLKGHNSKKGAQRIANYQSEGTVKFYCLLLIVLKHSMVCSYNSKRCFIVIFNSHA